MRTLKRILAVVIAIVLIFIAGYLAFTVSRMNGTEEIIYEQTS